MFKVNVESSIGWIEMTETLDEAVELLRGLIEADGKHVFYNMTNFHNSGIKSKNASCQLQWVTEENGQVKLISKSIMWINYLQLTLLQSLCSTWAANRFALQPLALTGHSLAL
jgi:hypothetical protein